MSKLSRALRGHAADAIAEDGRWLMGVPAIVADNSDPEKQHRVKVIIPSIDESLVFDEWARQMVFCLGNGFGSAFIPPKGSEVVLFGQLGQKYNLFYASLYNEELLMPDGFPDENTVGFRVPGNMKLLITELLRIEARNLQAAIEQLAKLDAANIEARATQLAKIVGQTVETNASQQNNMLGGQIQIQGTQITIDTNGNITIHGGGNLAIQGGNVTVTGNSIKLHGRTVNQAGPPI